MSLDAPSQPARSTESSWKQQFKHAIRDPLELCDRLQLPNSFRRPAIRAAESFPVFAPASYVQQMRLGDPDDPLLRQVLPVDKEIHQVDGFSTDPVGDQPSKYRSGMIQKYRGRVLLITTGLCAIHCRYCFRRHYPYDEDPKSLAQWQPAISNIAGDPSVHEIIFSGGDPLSLSDSKLAELTQALNRIPHLKRLRIHTRFPIVIPDRVTNQLLDWLTDTHMQCYFVLHANHANELSNEVLRQVKRLREVGIALLNQAVLLRGVNDSLSALVDLCEKLSDHGILPYYLNQLDRVQGAAHFDVPIAKGKQLIEQLRGLLPGYAVPRYVQEIAGEPNKVVLL